MVKILFVCHGNICRSPMAEFIMKDLLEKAGKENEFEVASAAVSREEIGNDIYPSAKRKLSEKGILYTHRMARQLTKEDYKHYDYIVCMDDSNLRLLNYIIDGDTDNKVSLLMEWCGESRNVADPWYTDDFETAYTDIMRACCTMLDKML